MRNETMAGSNKAQTRVVLARYEEWHNECRDVADEGSVYTMCARMERTCRASEIDLGLDLDLDA